MSLAVNKIKFNIEPPILNKIIDAINVILATNNGFYQLQLSTIKVIMVSIPLT